jgi:5,10-methylenetetrahydromethanopterin reductase
MKIGLNSFAGGTLDELVADAKQAEAEGFASFSVPNIFGFDAIVALSVVGTRTESMELMTGVVPTYPRHPAAIAQQAVTAQAACKGRFTLGVGLSHKIVIEDIYGMSYDKPAVHMREYLDVLLPVLNGDQTSYRGDQYTFRGTITVADPKPVPVIIAAMGNVMLRIAGERTAGTALWMTNAKAVSDHVSPRIRKAASNAGRPEPRIVCALPVALTNDPDAARAAANAEFEMYGYLPSYRAMLDEGGSATPGDAALAGDEAALDRALDELEEAGVTTFNASPFDAGPGSIDRTREYFADRARSRAG